MKSKGSEKFRPEYKGGGGEEGSTMYGICCPINRYQRSKICHNLNTSGACWVFKCPACKPQTQNIWGLWWPRYDHITQRSYCHKVQTGKQPKKIIFITQRALTKKRWQVGCCWNGFAPSPFFSYQNVHTHCAVPELCRGTWLRAVHDPDAKAIKAGLESREMCERPSNLGIHLPLAGPHQA